MATRSFIGIQNDDGTVDGIYCHWDGYLEGVGAMLRDFYGQPERVRQLLAGGSLSSLGPDIEPADGVQHTFQNPADGVCVFYARDRGDAGENSVKCVDDAGFLACAGRSNAEYAYILRGVNHWEYNTVSERNGRTFSGVYWRRLTEDAATAAD